MHKKLPAVLYVERNSFGYFTGNTKPLTFPYPPDSIHELDISNEQLFTGEVTAFFLNNKVQTAKIMIMLSADVLYEKEFIYEQQSVPVKKANGQVQVSDGAPASPGQPENAQVSTHDTVQAENDNSENSSSARQILTPSEQRTLTLEERSRQIQAFLDIVPIDEIASKTYKIEKGVKVVATNKKLYEAFIRALKKLSFEVDSVIPVTLIPKDIATTPVVTEETAKRIIKKFDLVRQYSLLEENSYSLSPAATETHGIKMTTKVTSKREYVLISIFISLLLVLGVIFYLTFAAGKPDKKVTPASQIIVPTQLPAVPSIIPSLTPEASGSAELFRETVSIQISGGTASQVNLLKQDLENNGYKNITARPNNIAATGKALVLFSASVPVQARESFLALLRQTFLNVVAQEAASPAADIIINL